MGRQSRDPWGAPLYNALQGRRVSDPAAAGPFQIDGKWYRQVDNGRANVLVPIDDPAVSPVVRAQQRADIERAFLMAGSPLSGGAYGLATLAGAPQRTRDTAMMTGRAADAVMQGAAPFGARAPRAVRPPSPQPPRSTMPREPAVYGPLTPSGQSTHMDARVTRQMLDTGKSVNKVLLPPGYFQTSRPPFENARGHLLAKQLGGEARTLAQVIAMTQKVNNSQMRRFEQKVKRRVRQGEVVDYFVRPLYDAPSSAPSMILMSARGSRSDFTPLLIPNPLGGGR
jgi:hypothetical protein